MKHPLKICVLVLCIMFISMAFANPYSRADNSHRVSAKKIISDNQSTPYHPPLRQGGVLFVEDGSGYGPPTNPDPVWDSILTEIYGTGNFGWLGPTTDPLEDGPDLTTMQGYELVIWHTYDQWDNPNLTTNDITNIGDYLSGGGKVWLIGQDLLYADQTIYPWMNTYFHLDTAYEDPFGSIDSLHIHGLAEIDCYSMISICDYAVNPFWTDELIPDTTVLCHAVLEDTINNAIIGIFYPGFGEWKTAFWAADVRDATFTTYWSTVIDIATGMLEAFEVLGISEMPSQRLERKLQLNITPAPIVNSTTISYYLPTAADVKLQIFNNTGQHIITLVDDYKYAGSYKATWNGKDARAVNVPNGVYFARLACGELTITENLVVIK